MAQHGRGGHAILRLRNLALLHLLLALATSAAAEVTNRLPHMPGGLDQPEGFPSHAAEPVIVSTMDPSFLVPTVLPSAVSIPGLEGVTTTWEAVLPRTELGPLTVPPLNDDGPGPVAGSATTTTQASWKALAMANSPLQRPAGLGLSTTRSQEPGLLPSSMQRDAFLSTSTTTSPLEEPSDKVMNEAAATAANKTTTAEPLSSPELASLGTTATTTTSLTTTTELVTTITTSTAPTTTTLTTEGATAVGTGKEDNEDQEAPRQCKPKRDKHGVWNGSRVPGGEYVLTCDPGYAVDKERTVTLTCSADEVEWNADPWCENVDDCSELMYGCGPAGLCVDHVGYSECICERGAAKKNMSNGEESCYFKNETKHCGGRNCGAHGICVDLTQYQQSFDTGDSSFRCSCERGFTDDGSTCRPVDCGHRYDKMGTWSGSSTYLGEYTLECKEGAFVLGGTQKAITVSCPADGRWESSSIFNVTPPKCLSPTQAAHDARLATLRLWTNIVMSLCCICGAAMAAGLTMGLLSLEAREMEIIQRARLNDCLDDRERERLEKQKDAARHILPLIKDHHLLLVTLLLLNALANEALPIFLDQLVPPFMAVLLSVTFVLMCGEILPSAVFTGPMQLSIASMFIPCVRLLLCGLFPIAKPIAVCLDNGLPHKSAEEELYTRPEIRAVLSLHTQGPLGERARSLANPRPPGAQHSSRPGSTSRPGTSGAEELLFDQEAPGSDDATAPLDPLESQICFGILDMGEQQVAESPAFRSLRRCASAFHAVLQSTPAAEAARAAALAGAEAVVVFRSMELVKWPIEVPLEELMGVVGLPELLSVPPGTTLQDFGLASSVAQVEATENVANALTAMAIACGSPCSYAAVIQRCEFMGLLDGEEVLSGLLLPKSETPSLASALAPSMRALPQAAADAVCEAITAWAPPQPVHLVLPEPPVQAAAPTSGSASSASHVVRAPAPSVETHGSATAAGAEVASAVAASAVAASAAATEAPPAQVEAASAQQQQPPEQPPPEPVPPHSVGVTPNGVGGLEEAQAEAPAVEEAPAQDSQGAAEAQAHPTPAEAVTQELPATQESTVAPAEAAAAAADAAHHAVGPGEADS